MKYISNAKAPSRQQGAALVVALIMLLVMTVLGITAMQVTRMQERMAGNSRDVNLAFQGAEAGLRDAEDRIRLMVDGPPPLCTATPCVGRPWSTGTWLTDHRDDLRVWWTTNGTEYGAAGTQEIIEIVRDPHVVAEHITFIPDNITLDGGDPEDGRDYYRVTATSVGASLTANVVLESTFTRRRRY